MQAILNRQSEPLSRATSIVCFVLPTMLFGVVLGAFALLYSGTITAHQYLDMYFVVMIVGLMTFFVIMFTIGAELLQDILGKQRQLSVLGYLLILMALGISLPRIFGFMY